MVAKAAAAAKERRRKRRRFRIDLGPLRGSSSPLQRFELARAKPARWFICPQAVTQRSAKPN